VRCVSEAHGLYWTASDNDHRSAPFYNFGHGSVVGRQPPFRSK
jgi:hypothetical protein